MNINFKNIVIKSFVTVKKKVQMINDIKNTNGTVLKNIFKLLVKQFFGFTANS